MRLFMEQFQENCQRLFLKDNIEKLLEKNLDGFMKEWRL